MSQLTFTEGVSERHTNLFKVVYKVVYSCCGPRRQLDRRTVHSEGNVVHSIAVQK